MPRPEAEAIDERYGSELDRPGAVFYGWRRGWELPELTSSAPGRVGLETEPPVRLLARLADLEDSEVERRLSECNEIFLLQLDGEPAAYGWSASGPAHIGGLALAFQVPPGERYLWDFVTLPAFRGRGLYPLLLQAILRRQSAEAEWFWIGHNERNVASRKGILKAGFKPAGQIWRLRGSQLGFVAASGAIPSVTSGAARALGLQSQPGQATPKGCR